MVVRIIKQVKMIQIIRLGAYVSEIDEWIPAKVYYKGYYTTAEDIQQRLEMAQRDWEKDKQKYPSIQEEVIIKEWWVDVEQEVK